MFSGLGWRTLDLTSACAAACGGQTNAFRAGCIDRRSSAWPLGRACSRLSFIATSHSTAEPIFTRSGCLQQQPALSRCDFACYEILTNCPVADKSQGFRVGFVHQRVGQIWHWCGTSSTRNARRDQPLPFFWRPVSLHCTMKVTIELEILPHEVELTTELLNTLRCAVRLFPTAACQRECMCLLLLFVYDHQQHPPRAPLASSLRDNTVLPQAAHRPCADKETRRASSNSDPNCSARPSAPGRPASERAAGLPC